MIREIRVVRAYKEAAAALKNSFLKADKKHFRLLRVVYFHWLFHPKFAELCRAQSCRRS